METGRQKKQFSGWFSISRFIVLGVLCLPGYGVADVSSYMEPADPLGDYIYSDETLMIETVKELAILNVSGSGVAPESAPVRIRVTGFGGTDPLVGDSDAPRFVDVIEVLEWYVVDISGFSVEPDEIVSLGYQTVVKWEDVARHAGNGDSVLTSDETFELTYQVQSGMADWYLPVEVEGEARVRYEDFSGMVWDQPIPPRMVQVNIPVVVDIMPWSDPNVISCTDMKTIIPVAILSTDEFDATRVDHDSVWFKGALEMHRNPKTGKALRHKEDVDGDGDLDLVFHFRLRDTTLTCSSRFGRLTGELRTGEPIAGRDAVVMVAK